MQQQRKNKTKDKFSALNFRSLELKVCGDLESWSTGVDKRFYGVDYDHNDVHLSDGDEPEQVIEYPKGGGMNNPRERINIKDQTGKELARIGKNAWHDFDCVIFYDRC